MILLLHSDCGAYGSLHQVFKDDQAAEIDHHRSELRLAYATVKGAFPKVSVECYFVDFAGVWQLESSFFTESAQTPTG